jgi:16S rRNA (uracil1498-N3)-methyltransferase
VNHPADAGAVAHVFVGTLADRCEIGGDDGHHLQRVRRLASGEIVTAADGSGAWRVYTVAASDAGSLTLDATSAVYDEPRSAIEVALAAALTKGGLDEVVASATELGVHEIIPVLTERTIVRWDAPRAAKAVARLRVAAREAAMQSRRATIPTVAAVTPLLDLAGRPGLVVADRTGLDVAHLPTPPRRGWTVLVGPEGGLSPGEHTSLAGAPRLALGANVLRAATAPIAALTLLTARAQHE